MSSFPCISHSCERAREWSSLEIDGELSAFEQAMLHAHLERCDDCLSYRDGIAGVAGLLQAAPLERLSEPIRVPSRAHTRFRAQRLLAPIAVAAVFVLAVISASTRLPVGGTGLPEVVQPAHAATRANADLIEQRKQRRAELSAIVHFPTTPGGPQLADVNSG